MFGKKSEESKIREIYSKLAPSIVADAAKQGITLDYSIESLKNVDKILMSLHKEYVDLADDISVDQKESYSGYADMLGCYMFAVVDKCNVPGKLTMLDDEYGRSPGFIFESGVASDFISWCWKAIENGDIDTIFPKFVAFSSKK